MVEIHPLWGSRELAAAKYWTLAAPKAPRRKNAPLAAPKAPPGQKKCRPQSNTLILNKT